MKDWLETWLRNIGKLKRLIDQKNALDTQNNDFRKRLLAHGVDPDAFLQGHVSPRDIRNAFHDYNARSMRHKIDNLIRENINLRLDQRPMSHTRRNVPHAGASEVPDLFANGDPKVSIVIPVYNGSDYLADAIDSALSQTYKNVEVVVVNDGSNDDGATDAIAKAYGDKITYIVQENKGVAGAMNTAVEALTGDLFCWLSHDDIHLPHKAQTQVDFLRELGRSDVMLFSNYSLINSDSEVWHTSQFDEELLRKTPSIALMRGFVNGCTIMVPVWALRKHMPFKEKLRYTQDYEMWDRVREDAEFVFQPFTSVHYRIHPGQDTNKPEASEESNDLWINMMDGRPESEMIAISGSRHKYFADLAEFLKNTPYKRAEDHASQQAEAALDVKVSIIIPTYNEDALAADAIRSAINQTYENIEIIVVDDGSTNPMTQVHALAEASERVMFVSVRNGGPGAARNLGMSLATGEYIAFLDSDDAYLPTKVRTQVHAMMKSGHVFSHTSYHVRYPQGRIGRGTLHSGRVSGEVYVDMLSGCSIATPTVMIHRSLVTSGWRFPTDSHLGEDILGWLWIAARYPILGVDEPLSIVTWRDDSAALNINKGIDGVTYMMRVLYTHPYHHLHSEAIDKLGITLQHLMELRETARSHPDFGKVSSIINADTINAAFGSDADRPVLKKPTRKVFEISGAYDLEGRYQATCKIEKRPKGAQHV